MTLRRKSRAEPVRQNLEASWGRHLDACTEQELQRVVLSLRRDLVLALRLLNEKASARLAAQGGRGA